MVREELADVFVCVLNDSHLFFDVTLLLFLADLLFEVFHKFFVLGFLPSKHAVRVTHVHV